LECRYKYTYFTCTRSENEREGEGEEVAASGTFLRRRRVVYFVQSRLSLGGGK
jgi:hypothetical protein